MTRGLSSCLLQHDVRAGSFRAGYRRGVSNEPRVAVIGAGFGGVAAALAVRDDVADLVVLERGDDVGGVWRENTYPGAACDVPSHLYSFSFAPEHRWSRRFAPQPDIQRYLRRVVDDHGLRRHLRLRTEVTEARWDEAAATWRLTTATGDTVEVEVLVAACGQLTRPARPDGGGARLLPRPRPALRALGSRRRPAGAARRRGRHRRQRRPDRAGDRRRGRAPDRLPALGRTRRPQAGPALLCGPPRAVPAPPRLAKARAAGVDGDLRARRRGAGRTGSGAGPARLPGPASRPGARRRPARAPAARAPARRPARPHLVGLLPHAPPSPRGSRHVGDRGVHPRPGSGPRTVRSIPPTSWCWPPASLRESSSTR